MALTNPPCRYLAQLLVDEGVGEAGLAPDPADWSVFHSFMPEEGADAQVCVFDTTAALDGRISRTGETVIHPGIQIRIRCRHYKLGWKKGKAILAVLDTIRRDSITLDEGEEDEETGLLEAFTTSSSLTVIGQEEKSRRWGFTVNGTLTISEVA